MTARTTPLVALLGLLASVPSTVLAQDALDAAPASPAQASAAQNGAADADDQDEAALFGEPLVVNGRRITDMEIKRFLCYGKGRNALESRRLGLLMAQEKELREYTERERAIEALFGDAESLPLYEELSEEQRGQVDARVAEALAYMVVRPEAVRAKLDKNAAEFHERYPTLDIDVETMRAYESVAWYEDQVRQTMEFDAMFFPGHPDDWPEITLEAVHAGAPEIDLIADYATHYERRAAEAAELGTEVEPEDEMMMSLLRDYVMAALASLVEIKTQTDGLPADVLMTIDGGGYFAELKTEDVFQEMKHVFDAEDVARAKKFLALQEAARQKLAEAGVLIPAEEFHEQIAGWLEAMEGSMFNWSFIALQGHQFPSVEAYSDHLYLLESFKRYIADDLDRTNGVPQVIQDHLPFANVVMGIGRCQADVLLVSAFDFPRYEWKENGWAWAEEHAFALRAKIDAYLDALAAQEAERKRVVGLGENFEPDVELFPFDRWWSDLLDLESEWWDPPMPMTGKMPPALGLKNKGRFQGEPMTRNDFKRAIGESSYSFYLENDSVTDKVFFDLEPGTVGGPYKGPWGYYLIYLKKRLAPTNRIDPNNEQKYQMLAEDYTRIAFDDFAHECLASAEVSGL